MQQVSLGRIVHYVLAERDCAGAPESIGQVRAAIVVRVLDAERGIVNLAVYVDGIRESLHEARDTIRRVSVTHDPSKDPGTWHWPERT